ncbi:phosphoglycerate mutase [candidate division WOR-3 bacterium]|mgnify:CR=1 FL=1|uniref:Phosphoglycerate mutase n=1 Tax=candidate division WOR-3 bacterium TaxID=2052148 RepID=A0A660SF86_UNCW3|nr:MAG: phosphoglycerate mutase [candidate division WOR-3 bacterium]
MIDDLITKSDRKICLLVIDGLGDIPSPTPLEAARTENLDRLTKSSALGLIDPVGPGITPGSGPGHLALFGYDPVETQIGRGLLEALGVGIEVRENDLYLRGNFATQRDGIVVDRRAGRIPTEETVRLCERLKEIDRIEDVEVRIKPGKEHRFVVVFNGEGLSAGVTDADPQKSGKEMVEARPLIPEAEKTARIINRFVELSNKILKGEKRANHVLLRGAATYPKLKTFKERFQLRALAIASYPMYLGIARLVGMETINPGSDLSQLFQTFAEHREEYDFFYLHIKETDKAGEDGDFDKKREIIEAIDQKLPILLEAKPDVLAITGDHSTPVRLRSHSWHPSPLLINSEFAPTDGLSRFTELNCRLGSIGRIRGKELMPLLLANSLRLKKYGA